MTFVRGCQRVTGLTLLAALSAMVLTGCTANKRTQRRWEQDLYYTHRLHIDGQHGIAAQRYATLKERSRNHADADEAGLMSCTSLWQAKAGPEAAACMDELAKSAHSRAIRTRSLLHAAQIRYDILDQKDDALLMFEQLITHAPGTPAGLRALDWLTRDGRTSKDATARAVARMIRLERANPDSQLADNLLLRAAMLLSDAGDADAKRKAIGLLARMESHHRHSSALLPGLMLRARLHRHFDEPRAEATTLHHIVRTKETSHVFGTYVEPVHAKAMERLVQLYIGPLRDPPEAERMLELLQGLVYKPARRYAYMAQLAKIKEIRGDKAGAVSTWRALLSKANEAQQDMRRNDQRICREEPTSQKVAACLQAIAKFGRLPIKEVAVARKALQRLTGRPSP